MIYKILFGDEKLSHKGTKEDCAEMARPANVSAFVPTPF
jgi:hypothetical protein